ncbi:MAG: pilus assembly protein PilM [Acidimicrobiales bacterium]
MSLPRRTSSGWRQPWTGRGPGRVVGVAYDDWSLRGVERRRPGRSVAGRRDEVLAAGAVELDGGVVEHGEIVDVERFAAALRSLWQQAGFATRRVVLGLDARAAVIRRVELPALPPAEMAQAAAYDIGELLSYPVEEALVSAVELDAGGRTDGSAIQVVILAVRQGAVVDLGRAARLAGLHPAATELVPAALVAAIGADRGLAPGSLGVVVELGAGSTGVVVHDRGGLLFSRVITAGLGTGAASLSDELEMELALLAGYAGGSAGSAPGGSTRVPGLATVVEGVRRTLHYYITELDDRPLDRIVLCGAQSGVGGLALELAETFPDAAVLRHEQPAWPAAGGDPHAYDDAASVALFGAAGRPDLRRFDLVPAPERARRSTRSRLAVGAAVTVALAPLLVADASLRWAERGETARESAVAEAHVVDLQGELATFQDAQARQAEADRASARVEALRLDDYGLPTVVRRMAEAMPADTFLVSLRVQRSRTGEAPTGWSGPPPPGVFNATGVAGSLNGVGRWLDGVQTLPLVSGLWLSQSAHGPYGPSEQVAEVFTVDGAITDRAEPVAVPPPAAEVQAP